MSYTAICVFYGLLTLDIHSPIPETKDCCFCSVRAYLACTHALEGVPIMDWRSKAACLSVDPELFFPIGNTGPAIAQAAEAKAVCRECAVQAICLQWALDNNQDSGVWGGMSEEERRSLKRRAARARRMS